MNGQITKNDAILELGKPYKFAGYNWTACELINNGKTAVIQSHGVTHGVWPGFKMAKFGGEINTNFAVDIDGHNISAYDNKMQSLYDAIKDVEDKSAPYGEGLYLISKEKAGFTEWDQPVSGDYWQALKKAAGNASSFGCPFDYAWLGTVYGSNYAWCVYSRSNVCGSSGQGNDLVVAPAFNLDLSKVEIVGDKIIIMHKENFKDDEKEYNELRYKLRAFNRAKCSWLHDNSPIDITQQTRKSFLAYNEQDRLVGGLFGHLEFNWLCLDQLYVNEEYRKNNVGTTLMVKAEQFAAKHKLTGIKFETWDFQAKAFYQKLGYVIYAVLNDCPPGTTTYFLLKKCSEEKSNENIRDNILKSSNTYSFMEK